MKSRVQLILLILLAFILQAGYKRLNNRSDIYVDHQTRFAFENVSEKDIFVRGITSFGLIGDLQSKSAKEDYRRNYWFPKGLKVTWYYTSDAQVVERRHINGLVSVQAEHPPPDKVRKTYVSFAGLSPPQDGETLYVVFNQQEQWVTEMKKERSFEDRPEVKK